MLDYGSVFSLFTQMQRLPRDFQLYVLAVVLVASAVFWVLPPDSLLQSWPELLLFMGLIAFASLFPVPDPRGGDLTSATTLFCVLFVVHDPGAALLVAGTANSVGTAISRGWTPWRTLFNGAQMGISVAVAGLVFRLLGGSVDRLNVVSYLLPFVAAFLAFQASNNFFVSTFWSRIRRTPVLESWVSDTKELLFSNSLTIPTAALLTILYVTVHPLTLLLYLVSLPVQRWATLLYIQQRRIYNQAIDSLVLAIDANFPGGQGHSRRVADLAVALARHMNLPDRQVEGIELASLIHDVGMIGLEGDIEPAPSAMSNEAEKRIKEHVVLGAQVTRDLPRRDVGEIVLAHHENFDGTGFPRGLKGVQIPLGARILALAEAFESMVSGDYPYAEKFSPNKTIEVIRSQAGKMFDPVVTDAFLTLSEGRQQSRLFDRAGAEDGPTIPNVARPE